MNGEVMVKWGGIFMKAGRLLQKCRMARCAAVFAAAAASAVCGSAAFAQASGQAASPTPTKLSQHEYWGAYVYKADNKAVCYILSTPTKQEPENVKHGDNFFLVSKRGSGKLAFEPQFMAGYDLKPESQVKVTVGAKSFSLFTKGNSAWIEGERQEVELLAAMRGGSAMEVSAVSKRGTDTSYIYSLKGISAAIKAVQKCK